MTSERRSVPPGALHPLVLVGLACGPFISMIDSNAVNVAIPGIVREMDSTVSTVGWIVGAYLLGIGAFLPATAWLADRFGNRRVYMVALAAFGAASAACAFAPTIEALIALRAAQGVASAPMIPLALALLFAGGSAGGSGGSGGGERARPPMAAGLCFFLAPALGPSAGGILVEAASWRWIFLVNVPLVIAGLLSCLKLPRDRPVPRADRRPLDTVGMLLLAAGATGVVLSSSIIPTDARLGWAVALVGVDLLAAYIWWQLPLRRPALSLGLVKSLAGAIPVAVSVVASLVLFAVLFLIPIFMMEVQGRSAIATGLVLLPQGIVMGLCTGLGEKLVGSLGFRATVGGGMLVLAATSALLLLVTPGTPAWTIALLLAGRGIALGLTLQPIIMGTLGRLPRTEVADVSTLFNVVQRLGGSLGVAGFAAFYQFRSSSEGAATAVPFHETVWLMTGLALVGALLAMFLPGRTAPREHTAHTHTHQDPCETVPDKIVAAAPPPVPAAPPSEPPSSEPPSTAPAPLPPLHSCPNCHHPISITTLVLPSPMDVTTITTGPHRIPVSTGPPSR
ncbi:MFS transporter [Actinomadura rugatobispora]|uniref:MFS transporter n=1 Tax=Actinomadura rugatobispora TaxID=1994 RepID=A0ABW1AFE4_9ACTN|nr:MDR family MFS transporter [Actinomadura rugatobispora]